MIRSYKYLGKCLWWINDVFIIFVYCLHDKIWGWLVEKNKKTIIYLLKKIGQSCVRWCQKWDFFNSCKKDNDLAFFFSLTPWVFCFCNSNLVVLNPNISDNYCCSIFSVVIWSFWLASSEIETCPKVLMFFNLVHKLF